MNIVLGIGVMVPDIKEVVTDLLYSVYCNPIPESFIILEVYTCLN